MTMITLDGDVLVLDRTQGDGDSVLPLVHTAKGKKDTGGWYVDLAIETEDVKHLLIDAEIIDDDVSIRYIARNGQQVEATAHIDEMICGPEGDLCRLQGRGKVPEVVMGDEPKQI